MGIKTQNIKNLFKDVRTRSIILVTGVLLLIGLIVGIAGLKKHSTGPQLSSQTGITPNIRSVPGEGESPSAEYAKLQASENVAQAQQAEQTGGSTLATLIGGFEKNDSNQATTQKSAAQLAAEKAAQEALAQQQAADAQMRAAQQAQLSADEMKQLQEQQQNVSKGMAGQAKKIFAAWSPSEQDLEVSSVKQNADGSDADGSSSGFGFGNRAGGKAAGNNKDGRKSQEQDLMAKAGDIWFAVLNTAVNSDEPGPVLATIVTGPYAGSRMLGSIKKEKEGERVSLSFTTISIPDYPKTFSVDAVAIDPDTARTALASEVNHHYLLRYGTLFASSFIEGWGQSVRSGTTTVSNGTVTQTQDQLDSNEQLQSALGTVGQRWGSKLGDTFDTPPTVIVHSGVSIGILFMKDAKITGEKKSPYDFTG